MRAFRSSWKDEPLLKQMYEETFPWNLKNLKLQWPNKITAQFVQWWTKIRETFKGLSKEVQVALNVQ